MFSLSLSLSRRAKCRTSLQRFENAYQHLLSLSHSRGRRKKNWTLPGGNGHSIQFSFSSPTAGLSVSRVLLTGRSAPGLPAVDVLDGARGAPRVAGRGREGRGRALPDRAPRRHLGRRLRGAPQPLLHQRRRSATAAAERRLLLLLLLMMLLLMLLVLLL